MDYYNNGVSSDTYRNIYVRFQSKTLSEHRESTDLRKTEHQIKSHVGVRLQQHGLQFRLMID